MSRSSRMSGRIESRIIKPDGAACKPLGTDRFTDLSVTDSLTLTPSLPKHVKCMHASANSIFSGPLTHLLSVLWVLMKILSHASAKKKTKRA